MFNGGSFCLGRVYARKFTKNIRNFKKSFLKLLTNEKICDKIKLIYKRRIKLCF